MFLRALGIFAMTMRTAVDKNPAPGGDRVRLVAIRTCPLVIVGGNILQPAPVRGAEHECNWGHNQQQRECKNLPDHRAPRRNRPNSWSISYETPKRNKWGM